jgi:hypothetical protein
MVAKEISLNLKRSIRFWLSLKLIHKKLFAKLKHQEISWVIGVWQSPVRPELTTPVIQMQSINFAFKPIILYKTLTALSLFRNSSSGNCY